MILTLLFQFSNKVVYCVLQQGITFYIAPVYSAENEYHLSSGTALSSCNHHILSVPLGQRMGKKSVWLCLLMTSKEHKTIITSMVRYQTIPICGWSLALFIDLCISHELTDLYLKIFSLEHWQGYEKLSVTHACRSPFFMPPMLHYVIGWQICKIWVMLVARMCYSISYWLCKRIVLVYWMIIVRVCVSWIVMLLTVDWTVYMFYCSLLECIINWIKTGYVSIIWERRGESQGEDDMFVALNLLEL